MITLYHIQSQSHRNNKHDGTITNDSNETNNDATTTNNHNHNHKHNHNHNHNHDHSNSQSRRLVVHYRWGF